MLTYNVSAITTLVWENRTRVSYLNGGKLSRPLSLAYSRPAKFLHSLVSIFHGSNLHTSMCNRQTRGALSVCFSFCLRLVNILVSHGKNCRTWKNPPMPRRGTSQPASILSKTIQ